MEFGVSQRHGGEGLNTGAQAFAAAIAARLGEPVGVRFDPDYESLWESLRAGAVRLAWLPPLVYARAHAAGLRLAAVPERGRELTYRAAVLVQRSSPLREVAQLQGVRAAWVDPSSASGYAFPRIELTARGASFSQEAFFGAAHDAARAVVSGAADLCACFVSPRAAEDPARMIAAVRNVLGTLADDLRVLHLTDPIPPDALVLGPGADDSRIVPVLLGLHRSVEGVQALQGLLHARRLVAADEALARLAQSWASR